MNLDRNYTCCFTGHRVLPPEDLAVLPQVLSRCIADLAEMGLHTYVTGGALGFDTLASEAVLAAKSKFPQLRLVVVAPHANQTAGWSRENVLRYERIRDAADSFVILQTAYTPGCMQRRNRQLVDQSCLCLAYCSHRPSGAGNTIDYALREGLMVVDLTDRCRAARQK